MSEQIPWIEACVLSLLAVNNYSLTKTWALRPRLHEERLLAPGHWEPSEAADALRCVGYDRGEFLTGLIAERVAHFLTIADESYLRSLSEAEALGTEEVTEVLTSIKGIGPVVAKNALLLRAEDV